MSRGRQANPVLTYETALRRFLASRRWRKPMAMGGFFRIAPLAQSVDEGGSCEWIGCHPQNIKTMRQFNLLVLGILGTFVNSFKIRMLL
jgi:hypothetical protein